jgi:hypothetical protein
MSELSDDRPMPERTYSPAVQRLAERYGMTPDAIEQIITGTSAIEPNADENTMPASTAAANVPVAAPVADVRPTSPETPRPKPENPRAAAKPALGTPKSGPGATIAIIAVAIIGLAIALSFKKGCFQQRNFSDRFRPNSTDTLQKMEAEAARQASEPPVQPTPVTPPQVPPEALVVPRETPTGTTGPPSSAGATTMQEAVKESKAAVKKPAPAPKPILKTSSYMQAEERLAELHASGFTKAHIVAKGTGERKTYSVYSR